MSLLQSKQRLVVFETSINNNTAWKHLNPGHWATLNCLSESISAVLKVAQKKNLSTAQKLRFLSSLNPKITYLHAQLACEPGCTTLEKKTDSEIFCFLWYVLWYKTEKYRNFHQISWTDLFGNNSLWNGWSDFVGELRFPATWTKLKTSLVTLLYTDGPFL